MLLPMYINGMITTEFKRKNTPINYNLEGVSKFLIFVWYEGIIGT